MVYDKWKQIKKFNFKKRKFQGEVIAAFKYLLSFSEKRKKSRTPEDIETNELKKSKLHPPIFIEHLFVPNTILLAKHLAVMQKTE